MQIYDSSSSLLPFVFFFFFFFTFICCCLLFYFFCFFKLIHITFIYCCLSLLLFGCLEHEYYVKRGQGPEACISDTLRVMWSSEMVVIKTLLSWWSWVDEEKYTYFLNCYFIPGAKLLLLLVQDWCIIAYWMLKPQQTIGSNPILFQSLYFSWCLVTQVAS